MGERILSTYLAVEQAVLQLRHVHEEVPIIHLDELEAHVKKISVLEMDRELVQRALKMLDSWGRLCLL